MRRAKTGNPACDVGGKSTRLPSLEFRASQCRGTGARFSYGEAHERCPSAGGSASSIGPTTRCSSSACIPRSCRARGSPTGPTTARQSGATAIARSGASKHLHRNGTRIVKFFLHLSKDEQRKRFLARINEPEKNWKFSLADIAERKFSVGLGSYEQCLGATSTSNSPWYIVPADDKKTARLISLPDHPRHVRRAGSSLSADDCRASAGIADNQAEARKMTGAGWLAARLPLGSICAPGQRYCCRARVCR